jgi:hypothetical protein
MAEAVASQALGPQAGTARQDAPASAVPDAVAPGVDGQAWAAFTSAPSDEAFCAAWLALQCGAVSEVRCALLLLRAPDGQSYAPAAIWPDPSLDLSHLSGAAQRALEQRRGLVVGLEPGEREGLAPGTVHVAYPIEADAQVMGAVVLELRERAVASLQDVLRQLLWGAGWLEALLRRRQLALKSALLERASVALDLVQAVQEHVGLGQAAMAVVNELATTVKADRVGLGMQRGSVLALRAISRTAWFDPKSQLVEAIENAMQEAMDQGAWTSHPALPGARGRVTVAQRDLALRSGAAAVLSLPLMAAGRPVGALTLERDQAPAFDQATVELCEAVCELLGPALNMRLEGERWFAGRAAHALTDGRAKLLGPRHQALKFGSALALLAALYLTFADAEFRVSARTSVEGSVQRAAVAPFDGYITEALVRAGAVVRRGDLLAVMDDRDLKLDRAKWEAEREQVARKYGEALAKRDRAATGIIAAQLNQADSQLALADEKLSRTRLSAPFDAVVVSGDLSQMLGAPVEKGKVLFELAPLDQYRVVLRVDERDIGFVAAGQRGEIALAGITGATLPFTVKTVTSVSTAQDGRNFFRVEAQLDAASQRLRPGMEGIGKVSIAERRLVWIWTRNFVNWARLAFWSWMP